jgi:hypothetical protein
MRMCKICGDVLDITDNYLMTNQDAEMIFICDRCLKSIKRELEFKVYKRDIEEVKEDE